MLYIYCTLNVQIRRLRQGLRQGLRQVVGPDRGETGPIGYAFMVSAIVLLAIFVATWGDNVARFFMERVEDVPVDGGDGGGGEGGN